jgi:hypothetical protein
MKNCHCEACHDLRDVERYLILCPKCGNKRCPHAENHKYKCTSSNELDQIGEEELITCGMECKPGKISKIVAEKLDQLIEMYEDGSITKSTLVVMIDEFYERRHLDGQN